ncbi:DUF559 domain-containing protein [Egibacter rhizosphaerae]|uniref:DUF559 domain-containing protein n=1 Tax=Egibacter rhizosphaerae TaxID=1670831 RepID=A0A411YE30_9ACTN|nr:type IV toxin-antitoxin system AbiEi family antitoxin domain-containing protein [Egibacter rhizosphaerae]QBI19458.1 DUF559 domain-containing protein [Egibacter rhizosphaerae]
MSMSALLSAATTTHGCVTTAQANALGIGEGKLRQLRREGVLETVHRGVHRVAGIPHTAHQPVAAALLALGDRAAASHGSAAHLLGLERVPRPLRPQLLVSGSHRSELPGVDVRRTRTLPAKDVCVVEGLRCTTGARTIIDLAATLSAEDVIALVDDAICARVTSRTWLHARATALSVGRSGVRTVARVTHTDAPGVFWSWLERRFDQVVRAAALPPPVFNTPLPGHPHIVVDALWLDPPLVVELDGLRFHGSPAQRRKDSARANEIALAGYPLLRFTWQDVVGEPQRVARELRAALHA